ncbi:MAG: T9SS type A sorting domain-containing protein [Bacteroidaceae bacterium]|nr:T9SS type A sorting domain-containing protein [Bacteroidaceae bacterium]
MKTRNLLAALLLMFGTCMFADENQFLTITFNEQDHNIALPLVQRISFEDNYLVVTTTEGTHKYPISLLDKISFTENATAIEALPESAKGMKYEDGVLSIKGDGFLRIFGTNGALLSIANVKEGANISLENFPAGIYIVRMGDKTIKIKK